MRKAKKPYKRRKTRSKPIKLDHRFWLRNAKEIRAYRERELLLQEYRCSITNLPLDEENAVTDHAHSCARGGFGDTDDGRVRGIISSDLNLLEGKYLKLFRKMRIGEKYNITFPDLLINMGEYLNEDYSEKPLHVNFMSELRNYIKRLNKSEILDKLESDFGIRAEKCTLHRDLVQIYVQEWVDRLESLLDHRGTCR